MKKNKKNYPQRKKRELMESEKKELRRHIEEGDDNVYDLAKEFGCSTSQIAGVKSKLNRGKKVK